MRPDSSRWVEVTPSEFSHERAGLTTVREALPDAEPYRAWSNFTFTTVDGRLYEVDLLVIGRSGLHLVELKHWSGSISGDGQTWRHNRRLAENPRILADLKAKRLVTLLQQVARERGIRVRVPFSSAAILLHAPDTKVQLDDRGRAGVYGLEGVGPKGLPGIVATLLTAPARNERDAVDARRSRELAKLLEHAGVRRSVRHRQVGTLLLDEELLAEGPGWQDYLGRHAQLDGMVRRVRFYLVGRAASAEQRATINRAAQREFAVLEGVSHPGIARAVDFVDHDRGPAIVFEHDPAEQRLDHFLAETRGTLTIDRQFEIVQELADTLRYAHGRRLTHRRLSPRSVTVRAKDRGGYGIRIRDWQTSARMLRTTGGTHLSGTQHLDVLTDPGAAAYIAPESYRNPDADGVLLDMFGLGAIAYHVLTGTPPAAGADDLLARLGADGGLDVHAVSDVLPDSIRDLVYEATAGEAELRTGSTAGFLAGIHAVLEELTSERPEREVDPLDAEPGDVVGTAEEPTRFLVERPLGRGSTAQALLVEDLTGEKDNRCVLKIALDEGKDRRLRDEAEVLAEVRDPRVAAVLAGPLTVGGRTALLLEDAGRETLEELLRQQGRLSIDLLERWGRDLLEILQALDLVGVNHRDIKPDNLAHREIGKRRQRHLTLFDFSLSRAPLEQTRAGTPPYLDPFFDPARRPRWDAAAERYAVAVTLHEMATGTTPVYGSGESHPSMVADEATLDPGLFDPAVADGLVAFFRRALRRDPGQRYDTAADMLVAWSRVFTAVPAAADEAAEPVPSEDRDRVAAEAGIGTPLDRSGLTPRAVNALTRLGVATVGDLLARPPLEMARVPGVSEPTRREVRRRARQWRQRLAPAAAPHSAGVAGSDPTEQAGTSVDAVLAGLVPASTGRNDTEVRAVRTLLGLAGPGEGGRQLWPSLAQVGTRLGVSGPRVGQILGRNRARWAKSDALAEVREAVVALVEEAGGVVAADDVAHALLVTRGTTAEDGAHRLARGFGLVRAAVEVELDRGGEARLVIRRVHHRVLLAREPDDPEGPEAALLLDFAVALGRVADQLAAEDALPSAERTLEHLRAVATPEGAAPIDDGRLSRLAAAASVAAAVTSKGETYPVGLAPERALRAIGSSLTTSSAGVDVRQLRERVRARYPLARPLPPYPDLDGVLRDAGLALDFRDGRYFPPAASSSQLSTGARTATHYRTRIADDAALPVDLADLEERLRGSLARRGFLALTASASRLDRAVRALTERFDVRRYDVTAALLAEMRRLADENDVDWAIVLRADRPDAGPRDSANLRQLVAAATPAVEAHLAQAAEPLLLVDAEPLARYGRLGRLEELADPATARPAARWLLVAADGERRLPHLDGQPAPTTGGWLHLPSKWTDLTSSLPGKAS